MHYLYELWHFVLFEWQIQENVRGLTYLYIIHSHLTLRIFGVKMYAFSPQLASSESAP